MNGKIPAPLFDTQVAAMVCGFGDSIAYNKLVEGITGTALAKNAQFTDWSRRPLSSKQLTYALDDVIYLRDVYEHLSKALEKQGRTSWLKQEMDILTNPTTYDAPLDEVYKDIAVYMPKDEGGLSRIRNVPKDMTSGGRAKNLLRIIKDARNSNKDAWPKVKRGKAFPKEATPILEMLKMARCINFMLKLFLLRHAQAVNGFDIADKDRALTEYGINQSKELAAHIQGVDLCLCSDAMRTRMTYDGLIERGAGSKKISYRDALYNAPAGTLLDAIQNAESPITQGYIS